MRHRNTDRRGTKFSLLIIEFVWRKGNPIPGYSSLLWRFDLCGTPICRSDYGDTNSIYGWEIDHINPVALGGLDDLSNLQPLQWETNRQKGDRVGANYCAVESNNY